LIPETLETTSQEWQELLTGELLMFTLLGKMLLQIPEKSWLQPILDEALFSDVPFAEQQVDVRQGLALFAQWSQQCDGTITPQGLTDLKADHTRLFTGLANIPVAPWESVFFTEERLVFQKQTQDVRDWYQRYGMTVVSGQYKEPEDHIGLELTFMAHLAKIGLAALAAQNQPEFEQALAAQREFAQKHLFLWAPLWCSLIQAHAKSDFYRSLAQIVYGMLLELAIILDVNIAEVVRS